MTIQRSQPLPECRSCDAPTRRDVFRDNRGYCTSCARLRPAWALTQEQREAAAHLGEWQELAAQRGREAREAADRRAARRTDELAERRRRRAEKGTHRGR